MERYFGLHFDFHAGNEAHIGSRTDPADIAWYLEQAQPDFVQCDCKGHPGNASYPTSLGNAAAHLDADNLKIWSDTVHGRGLPLFVHYSGVYDAAYTAAHPDQAAVDENGQRTDAVSVFGDYADRLLIPQLEEVMDRYGIDGVWIDGDCWSVRRDDSARARPHLRPGLSQEEHNRIMREGYLAYVRHYTDALHAYRPDFKVISNWLYSSQVPEKPEIGVDFLSGDFTPNDSAHAARFEARCMALQGKPWDLMAWGFSKDRAHQDLSCDKPAAQLCQEAAVVLSLGGGFQVYISQNAAGSARRLRSTRLREIHDFVAPRRALNFQKPPLAQIGLYYSAQSRYHETAADPSVFNPPHVSDSLIGTLHCLLDGQYTVNCVLEHQRDTLGRYDVVVVPAWTAIPQTHRQGLLTYARNGGKLVVLGPETCRAFGADMGLIFGETETGAKALCTEDGLFCRFYTDFLDLQTGEGALYRNRDLRDGQLPAYRTEMLERGSVTFLPFDLGTAYLPNRSFFLTEYLRRILSTLCTPWAELNRSDIDITFQQGDGETVVNLINLRQDRHSLEAPVFRTVPPAENVELRLHRVCREVTMPLGETFTWEVSGGDTVIHLPKLEIHSVLLLK